MPNPSRERSNITIDYCLAEPSPLPECTVSLSQTLLAVVVVFNAVKATCFLATLQVCTSNSPLITIGDAISSFLERPDPLTRGHGTLPPREINQHWEMVRCRRSLRREAITCLAAPSPWCPPEHRQWFEGVTPRRWIITMSVFVAPRGQ